MITIVRNLYQYRELLQVLVWKNITLRYEQSYLGMAWLVLRPLMLVADYACARRGTAALVDLPSRMALVAMPNDDVQPPVQSASPARHDAKVPTGAGV